MKAIRKDHDGYVCLHFKYLSFLIINLLGHNCIRHKKNVMTSTVFLQVDWMDVSSGPIYFL